MSPLLSPKRKKDKTPYHYGMGFSKWRMGDSNPDYSTKHGIIFIIYRNKCVPRVLPSPCQILTENKKCVLSLCTFSRCYGCIKDAIDVLGYYFILSVDGVRVHAVCIHILAVPDNLL